MCYVVVLTKSTSHDIHVLGLQLSARAHTDIDPNTMTHRWRDSPSCRAPSRGATFESCLICRCIMRLLFALEANMRSSMHCLNVQFPLVDSFGLLQSVHICSCPFIVSGLGLWSCSALPRFGFFRGTRVLILGVTVVLTCTASFV